MDEVETRPLISIRGSATVQDAAKMICDLSIGAMGVIDEASDLVGVFTERDLAWAVAQGKDSSLTTVDEVMNDFPIIVDSPLSWAEAAAHLDRAHVRHLIVRRGRDHRIVSARDVLRSQQGGEPAHPASAQELRRWFGVKA